ncbi:Methyltransferase-like protein 2-A [Coelomomyces lativittatus]|nr:Methyltransferase-like protein 2-A [Coelomomyces lativittatus]KAJ1505303.1 Methyltransferase-like protein 2-A [Coelomomyces lativittatus]
MMSTIASTSSLQNNNKQSTVQNKKTTSSCLPTATTSTLSSTTVDDRAASLISPSQSTSSTTNSTTSSTNSLSAFGGRCLTDPDHVFTQNAWDHVEFSPSTLAWAETQLAYQRSTPCDSPNLTSLAQPWNQFYSQHQDRFFKHRHWLPIEFPELFSWEDPPLTLTTNENGNGNGNTKYIMEVGCGVGNTVFPLLEHMAFIRTLEPSSPSNMPDVRIVACDFSVTAIDVLKVNMKFNERKKNYFFLKKDPYILHMS